MRRRQFLLVLGIGVFLAAGSAVAVVRTSRFQKWYNPPALGLPADDEVAEMRASLRESQVGFRAIAEFVVPAERVPVILGWLRPAEYVPNPPILPVGDELGEVIIRTRAGRQLRLRFYWAGKNPAVLTPDGEDHFWGRGVDGDGQPADGGIGLGRAIREAQKASER